MKIVIRVALALLSIGLFYALYSTIQEPIQFRKEYSSRKEKVVTQLKDIRKSQKLYRTITDTFASNFSDLERVLTTGRFTIIQASGDRDALGVKVTYDTIFVAAKDSLKTLGLNVKGLSEVPFSNGKEFKMTAGIIDQQGYEVPTLEVSARYSEFMGKYASPYFAKYDERYDPKDLIKFGSRVKANLAGNWE